MPWGFELLKRNVTKLLLASVLFAGIFVSSTAKTRFTDGFDDTLKIWLAQIGFKGDVLEYQKVYDGLGYIDYFRILLEEHIQPNSKERTQAKIFFEVTDNEAYEFATVKILNKDIKQMPYMYADWTARYAISYAIKKVSKMLALQAKTTNLGGGLYKVTIDPAKSTVASRYRFNQIEAFYEIDNLILDLTITVKGDKDYLILSFLKGEINGILKTLENGNLPGATSAILASGLASQISDHLIRDLLKVPEAGHETLLQLERSPELKVEQLDPVDSL